MNDFEEFWRILCEAFPENEHRSRVDHEALLDHPLYQLNYIREDGKILGFWSVWNLSSFLFVEHLALDRRCQGKQYGSAALNRIVGTAGLPLVLEVEKPETEDARRRIGFYQRMGVHLNPFDYFQPPLQVGCDIVPMHLMSWPDPLDEAGFTAIRKELYDTVYGGYAVNPHTMK